MEDISFFRKALQSFLQQSAAFEPQIQHMSKILFQLSECMVEVYLHSEFMKKPSKE